MPKFYQVNLVAPDGKHHLGVHGIILDLLQCIRPISSSKYLYAIFADRPNKEGQWRGTFLDPEGSDERIFSSGDMVPVRLVDDNGIPFMTKACVNSKFYTHFETGPFQGRTIWMLFGMIPGMNLKLDPEGSKALLGTE